VTPFESSEENAMSGTSFPPGSSPSIASRIRTDAAREIPPTSVDQEGLPPEEAIPANAFSLTTVLILFMIALGVVGILIVVLRGIYKLPAWP
jgi:hypothetical protein